MIKIRQDIRDLGVIPHKKNCIVQMYTHQLPELHVKTTYTEEQRRKWWTSLPYTPNDEMEWHQGKHAYFRIVDPKTGNFLLGGRYCRLNHKWEVFSLPGEEVEWRAKDNTIKWNRGKKVPEFEYWDNFDYYIEAQKGLLEGRYALVLDKNHTRARYSMFKDFPETRELSEEKIERNAKLRRTLAIQSQLDHKQQLIQQIEELKTELQPQIQEINSKAKELGVL